MWFTDLKSAKGLDIMECRLAFFLEQNGIYVRLSGPFDFPVYWRGGPLFLEDFPEVFMTERDFLILGEGEEERRVIMRKSRGTYIKVGIEYVNRTRAQREAKGRLQKS